MSTSGRPAVRTAQSRWTSQPHRRRQSLSLTRSPCFGCAPSYSSRPTTNGRLPTAATVRDLCGTTQPTRARRLGAPPVHAEQGGGQGQPRTRHSRRSPQSTEAAIAPRPGQATRTSSLRRRSSDDFSRHRGSLQAGRFRWPREGTVGMSGSVVHATRKALIDDLNDAPREEPSVGGEWTVHGVVAELIDWPRTTRLGFVVGLARAKLDFDCQNARGVARRRGASLRQTLTPVSSIGVTEPDASGAARQPAHRGGGGHGQGTHRSLQRPADLPSRVRCAPAWETAGPCARARPGAAAPPLAPPRLGVAPHSAAHGRRAPVPDIRRAFPAAPRTAAPDR